jgi:hypothetical protein
MARSANLDFFAAEADQRAVLDFLFSSTDVRVFESYSEYDANLREFCSTEDLAATVRLGTDPGGSGHAVLLQLWSPSAMRELTIRRFDLDPAQCDGRSFRHNIEGAGLMQLYLGGVCGQVVTMSHFGHQSQARARRWQVDDGVNWDALQKLSNRVQYHVRKRLAAGRVPGRPVLRQALQLAEAGYSLELGIQAPWSFELQPSSRTD